MTVLAIDIGGTKIAAALVDGGTLVHRTEVPTPQTSAEDAWGATAELITATLAAEPTGGVEAIGISSAGPVDLGAGTISPVNIAVWRDFPIVARVAQQTGLPVRLGGDGLCMALGEHRYGAGRGAQFLLGMVVSTGIGGGLVLGGVPYDGRTGNAGHVGHTVIELDGQRCPCGGRGCVETVASGPAMTRWARAQGWAGTDAKQLAADVQRDDPIAVEAFRRGATAVAAMIASTAAVCDLDLAVIGGGVAKAGPVLFDPLRAALADYAGLAFLRSLRVVPAELGSDAGLIGAGVLATT
ncbi:MULTISPECIES: ROK family protein [Mycobacteriaceae]|uniref:ROK family transcriptional regulator n=1 Tax=Mycolicibacterium neoaurum VKM Ac-1815D TaxID=700508 RepID=V5X895_MYCNE|nr:MULTISPECIES: ROK family protein [Mycobacteriaceae]AHC24237.1 ROK family transcriptional regulator [Mycolicibacterium neoaurum VKM Ac-1815D]AMO04855.1 ROK family transcriptional regulator [Mycolicibacterium neoaurum]AXK76837.1 ROK family protein [Mycolicibacterium neoaurum]KJQ51960.1 ROK family transcriptional regulator [Mycolicibacterium neoaurum]KUM10256.1 ROK family transcriptional regulator [Mycolicibacterium neoaurum]